jgi:hypothetical protein
MSAPLASYSFLSWVRQGLGIHTQDAPAGRLRGRIPVSVMLRGDKVGGGGQLTETFQRDVALYGPGDVIGIETRAIVRSEPRGSIMNFEPNYLPFVEFYDEDFLWRYTPSAASPDGKRLVPWLTLVVLEEGEFEGPQTLPSKPLPFIKVNNANALFPPTDQLWAWAHVHVDKSIQGIGLADRTALAQFLGQTVAANRDMAYSRLLCPRSLLPSRRYRGFIIPTFETGRLAGLGLDPNTATLATQPAWGGTATEFPIYYTWAFGTSTVGDFEYLVRLLKPRPADSKVGVRDIDVQEAGSGIGGIDAPALNNILRIGGALRVPFDPLPQEIKDEITKFDEWAIPFPRPFQQRLTTLVNLPDTYQQSGTSVDPLIAPPIYGRWHAAVERLVVSSASTPAERTRWLNELNLDPRYRAAAGIGTTVVQKNQEEYMEAAWQQVGKVLAGNQKVRHSHFAMAATIVWNQQNFIPLQTTQATQFLMVVAPVQKRIVADGLTVGYRVQQSPVPAAAMSKVMRQALRPRARIARRIGFDANRHAGNIVDRLNSGEVVAAPPKTVPPGLPTGDKVADALQPSVPSSWIGWLRQLSWLRWLPLAIAIVLALFLLLLGAPVFIGLVLIVAGVLIANYLMRAVKTADATATLVDGGFTPSVVDALPTSPDFHIGEPGSLSAPSTGGNDNEEARRFKLALREAARVEMAEGTIQPEVRTALQIGAVTRSVAAALKPEKTIPAWTRLHVSIPDRIRQELVDPDGEVMVYPELDMPMYEPLKDLSSELFLPNIQLIENNTITLLETNQKFIEAYMTGLNHEFSRELLWREYPTDQRGSYFRQFWDATGFLVQGGASEEETRERLRDITRLHTWKQTDTLNDHDNREAYGDKEEELVLVVRGELLKKYPNAIVYAHRAEWERVGDVPTGAIDKTRPRRLRVLTAEEEASELRRYVKTPLYDASVAPDIYFFGFDLTVTEALNGADPQRPGETADDGPGWFFVIKERPGEPRFGLDIAGEAPQASITTWNQLAWSDVGVAAGASLRAGSGRDYTLTPPVTGVTTELQKQYQEDSRFRWRVATDSAELAYILYQAPVLMAVHASEMLPKES